MKFQRRKGQRSVHRMTLRVNDDIPDLIDSSHLSVNSDGRQESYKAGYI